MYRDLEAELSKTHEGEGETKPVISSPVHSLVVEKEKLLLPDQQFLGAMLGDISEIVEQVAPNSRTTGRVKTAKSIEQKAKRYGLDPDMLHDKVGIRVIVERTEQCFVVVDELHDVMEYLAEGYDDYIKNPKPNGYRSLHTTLVGPNGRTLEVQVRSIEMHACAEQGTAFHGHYKRQQRLDLARNHGCVESVAPRLPTVAKARRPDIGLANAAILLGKGVVSK